MPLRLKTFHKCLCHFFSYFKTVLADAWPDAGDQILRAGSKGFFHGIYGTLSHSVYSAPPTGMGKADGFMFRIHKIQRHTVCIKGCQCKIRHIGDQSVHICVIPLSHYTFSSVFFCHKAHIGGMGLLGCHHAVPVNSQCLCHTGIVFQHISRIISFIPGKVHSSIFSLACPSQTGGKSIYHKACLFQGSKRKIGNPIFFPVYKYILLIFIIPWDHLSASFL